VFKGRDSEIAETLGAAALLSSSQIEAFVKQAFEQSRDLSECVLSAGIVNQENLLQAVATCLGFPIAEAFKGERFDHEQVRMRLPMKPALTYGAYVLGEDMEACHLAIADPFDSSIDPDLRHFLEKPVLLYVADPGWVQTQLFTCYPTSQVGEVLNGLEVKTPLQAQSDGLEHSATIVDYVDALLQKAIHDGASDIHFEPFEHRFRIRYRVDGDLREIPSHADHLGSAIVSRIKVMAQLNIAEIRVPQDGRIQVHTMGRIVDVRVSTLPTQFGESVVLRILDKTRVNLDLELLGIPGSMLAKIRNAIHSPNGIFLATGPTGSGKTTTLYSALQEVNGIGSKLLTVEDPVEYDIEGIVQVQTHALIGLDFSRVLRAFLRHDPDKILLGEIRDPETARIAVQASLTGHMVFSSLHTNDASGAVARFIDMGIEPYLVAASLVAVLAQRLLRRLDPERVERYHPEAMELSQLGFSRDDVGDGHFFRPPASSSGDGSAYRGRVGLYELIRVNDAFREAISAWKSHAELTRIACENGMRTLRQDALRPLLAGQTTVQEVLRYT